MSQSDEHGRDDGYDWLEHSVIWIKLARVSVDDSSGSITLTRNGLPNGLPTRICQRLDPHARVVRCVVHAAGMAVILRNGNSFSATGNTVDVSRVGRLQMGRAVGTTNTNRGHENDNNRNKHGLLLAYDEDSRRLPVESHEDRVRGSNGAAEVGCCENASHRSQDGQRVEDVPDADSGLRDQPSPPQHRGGPVTNKQGERK